jgi:peptidyl-prolyl cis-trans isomerase B (cyclophilin B)
MYFRNLFLSLFVVFAVGFALVQAEDSKEPRGPKITSKVSTISWPGLFGCTAN